MKFVSLIIIVLVPVTIITSGILLLSGSFNFYKFLFIKSGSYQNFQSSMVVDRAALNLLSFFKGNEDLDSQLYSNQAQLHLKDVKNIFKNIRIIFLASLFLLIFDALHDRKSFLKDLRKGSILTLLFTIVVSFLFIIDFDSLFLLFHQVLFKNNLWLFASNDPLIQIFPQSFFVSFAQILGAYMLGFVALNLAVSKILENDKTNY